MQIPFFDIKKQYQQLKNEIDDSVNSCLASGQFIGGNVVREFEKSLSNYIGINHVVSCGNGTDALQLALMSLDLPKKTKIIVPSFTFIAPIEVCTFLGFDVVFADVDESTFNITLENIKAVYTEDVKAVVVVHLFGQPCRDIDAIYNFCQSKNIYLIEDNAQSLGAEKNIKRNSIITTSFFPTKNLGAFGDGGAVLTNDIVFAEKIKQLASHGQTQKYTHQLVGINSRLDALQASILNVKLKHLDKWIEQRKAIAQQYTQAFSNLSFIQTPNQNTHHSFHQYTIKIDQQKRNHLKNYLAELGIETTVYYPISAHQQKAYLQNIHLPITEKLCDTVLSLPIFPELSNEEINYIIEKIKNYQ